MCRGAHVRPDSTSRLVSVTRWNIGKNKKRDVEVKENETANAVKFEPLPASISVNITDKISPVLRLTQPLALN